MKKGIKLLSAIMASLIALTAVACTGETGKGTDKAKDGTDAETKATDASEEETETANGSEEETQSEGSEAAKNGGSGTIRMSWWGGDERHELTQKAIEAFMAANEGVTVESEFGAWDGWAEKVATQLTAGTAPDVMQINWNWLYQFSSDGSKFVDLRETEFDLSQYPENILEQCIVADKLQGVPIGTTGKVFYWNKAAYDKAGLELPKTFDDLIAAGEVFKEKLGDDAYPLSMYQYERMILMLYYLQSKYGKNWVENGEPQYTEEEVKEGLDWICMLEEKHVLPSIATVLGDGATTLDKNSKWASGLYGGNYEWDSAASKLRDALEEGQEFVVGDFLTGLGENKAGLTKISQTFAITETSENKEVAANLMNFLLNNEEGIKILKDSRGMLANKKANEVLEAEKVFEGSQVFEANQKVMEIAGFSFDPNFENSELKDSTGVYYEVFENISDDHESTAEMAKYLLEETVRVSEENPY